MPTRQTTVRPSRRPSTASSSAAPMPKICSAKPYTTRPFSVSSSRRPRRSKIRRPSCSSSLRSCSLTVGCETPSRLAAAASPPASTIAVKYWRWW